MHSYVDPIREKDIQDQVSPFYKIMMVDSIDSTNSWLSMHTDLNEGTVLIANEQTGGKGRNGRSFYSFADVGIYLSLLLKPKEEIENILHYTALCAVSMCEAIEEIYGFYPSIKWLNDIYYQDKKLGGILCEGKLFNGKFESLILGIGINVHSFIRPEEIALSAASIEDFVPIKKPRHALITKFLQSFYSYYDNRLDFFKPYKERLAYLNKQIQVIYPHEKWNGTLLGVDNSFRLIVEKADHSIHHLSSGEISIRP